MKKVFYVLLPLLFGACQTLPTSAEWLARGDGYFQDGKYQQSLKAYNRAWKLNDQNAAVYASRGAAYFFLGEYAAAHLRCLPFG